MCDQNCGVQSGHRQTHEQTDRKVKTEGPKILSNDIFYLNVIIGVPTSDLYICAQCWLTLSTKKSYIQVGMLNLNKEEIRNKIKLDTHYFYYH